MFGLVSFGVSGFGFGLLCLVSRNCMCRSASDC